MKYNYFPANEYFCLSYVLDVMLSNREKTAIKNF